ncbi:hypothetical protein PR048_028381 [Dryococelus australis]|uniref:Uncharacterized protein n=1 Tax=Dryococelus australis TaxID=614101 RepID=A0ABQ9GJ59_9NEOP|nr:hypothetical protein PR048_028381 [Dryococelus australis]
MLQILAAYTKHVSELTVNESREPLVIDDEPEEIVKAEVNSRRKVCDCENRRSEGRRFMGVSTAPNSMFLVMHMVRRQYDHPALYSQSEFSIERAWRNMMEEELEQGLRKCEWSEEMKEGVRRRGGGQRQLTRGGKARMHSWQQRCAAEGSADIADMNLLCYESQCECIAHADPALLSDDRVLQNLLSREERYSPSPSYFGCVQVEVTSDMRRVVAEWLLENEAAHSRWYKERSLVISELGLEDTWRSSDVAEECCLSTTYVPAGVSRGVLPINNIRSRRFKPRSVAYQQHTFPQV